MTYAEQIQIFNNMNFNDERFDTPIDSLDKLEEVIYADSDLDIPEIEEVEEIQLNSYQTEILNAINEMKDPEALGQVFVFTRDENNFLVPEQVNLVDGEDLDYGNLEQYEMIVIDGGTSDGECWKKVFTPNQQQSFVIYEN